MIEKLTIVDGHTHTYPTYDKAVKILNSFTTLYKMKPTHLGKGTIEEVVSNMQRDCIDYTILANFAPIKILHQNNIWTIDMSKRHTNLVPLISIHPQMEGNILSYLKQYKELGVFCNSKIGKIAKIIRHPPSGILCYRSLQKFNYSAMISTNQFITHSSYIFVHL